MRPNNASCPLIKFPVRTVCAKEGTRPRDTFEKSQNFSLGYEGTTNEHVPRPAFHTVKFGGDFPIVQRRRSRDLKYVASNELFLRLDVAQIRLFASSSG